MSQEQQRITISLIAAASTNNVIGKNNHLLWHLPNDTRFFKNITWGMPVIMGRKTYESLSGQPLPGRFNFVLTHQQEWNPLHDKVTRITSIQEGINLSKETDCKETFIIGGGQLYVASISMSDKIYLTRVHTIIEGDAWFPEINKSEWQLISNIDFPTDAKHRFAYSFQVWERKRSG